MLGIVDKQERHQHNGQGDTVYRRATCLFLVREGTLVEYPRWHSATAGTIKYKESVKGVSCKTPLLTSPAYLPRK